MAPPDFFTDTDTGIRLLIRATPGAAKNEITGVWRGVDDEHRLAIKITAPPDKGKANAAIIKLLAKATGLAKSSFTITAGETARLKTINVSGESKILTSLFKTLTGE